MSTATSTPARKFIMNDPLQDLKGLDHLGSAYVHGEHLIVLWALTKEPELRPDVVDSIAKVCIDFANSGVNCLKKDRPSFAIRKFVNGVWDVRTIDTMSKVFNAYVKNGIIDPNQHLDGEPALAGAIMNGNMNTAELLILNGASTKGNGGECLYDMARKFYGKDSPYWNTPEMREAATAHMLSASMRREIDAAAQGLGDSGSNASLLLPSISPRARRVL